MKIGIILSGTNSYIREFQQSAINTIPEIVLNFAILVDWSGHDRINVMDYPREG